MKGKHAGARCGWGQGDGTLGEWTEIEGLLGGIGGLVAATAHKAQRPLHHCRHDLQVTRRFGGGRTTSFGPLPSRDKTARFGIHMKGLKGTRCGNERRLR